MRLSPAVPGLGAAWLRRAAGCSQADVEDCYSQCKLLDAPYEIGPDANPSQWGPGSVGRRGVCFESCMERNNARIACCKDPATSAC